MNKGLAAVYEAGAYRFMGSQVMLITTTGRKTGRCYTTPLGYVQVGKYVYALTRGSEDISNWLRNLKKTPEVTLQLGGQSLSAGGEVLEDPVEIRQVLKLFLKHRPGYERFLKINLNSSEVELESAARYWLAVRFQLKPATQGTK